MMVQNEALIGTTAPEIDARKRSAVRRICRRGRNGGGSPFKAAACPYNCRSVAACRSRRRAAPRRDVLSASPAKNEMPSACASFRSAGISGSIAMQPRHESRRCRPVSRPRGTAAPDRLREELISTVRRPIRSTHGHLPRMSRRIRFGRTRLLVSSYACRRISTSGPSTLRRRASSARPFRHASVFDGIAERTDELDNRCHRNASA